MELGTVCPHLRPTSGTPGCRNGARRSLKKSTHTEKAPISKLVTFEHTVQKWDSLMVGICRYITVFFVWLSLLQLGYFFAELIKPVYYSCSGGGLQTLGIIILIF